MSRNWQIRRVISNVESFSAERVIEQLLDNRGITRISDIREFLTPKNPHTFTAHDVGIDKEMLDKAIHRIRSAIDKKESIVVYADYDADGITAGAILWETLWKLGARAMPYIPHRVEEGYGLSEKGIDAVRLEYDPSLIITVDHGITAWEKVEYAKKLGIEVIVTDHHVKPETLPKTTIVHTTLLSGSGVSWFVAKTLLHSVRNAQSADPDHFEDELVALSSIGTIADLLPLVGINRSLVKHGLGIIRKTKRIGLNALINEAGMTKESIDTYSVSHMLAPRLNAMGRLEHALDALRLLCTNDQEKARVLADKLGLTNKERQQLTVDTVTHARKLVPKTLKNLIFISHESYNPGIIGLVAGRLVEEYYRPTIVLAIADGFAKASARSIAGFNIVEAIRRESKLLVDVGGHPMAAGFTVEVKNLKKLQERLESFADDSITKEMLVRILQVDLELPLSLVSETLWKSLQALQPFGFGNYEPIFASRGLSVSDARLIGSTKKHLKLKVRIPGMRDAVDVVGFNMADVYSKIAGAKIDMAYTVDMNEWNGKRNLQLKAKDIIFPQ